MKAGGMKMRAEGKWGAGVKRLQMIKRGSGLNMEKQQENQVCGSSEILLMYIFSRGMS